ncbi:tol-pal system protein YbgF [Burkholderiales bacterium JOSHI_001]|nr:tol-pal system protein YbgF [Burkholderiales bacterium JOSHI_001]
MTILPQWPSAISPQGATLADRRSRIRGVRMVGSALLLLLASHAQAGLFDDDEARKAILDLRTRIQAVEEQGKARQNELAAEQTKANAQLQEQLQQMRRSLLELNNQLELLRADLAKLRGQDEQLARDVAEVQRRQKDLAQGVDERVRKLEPQKVTLEGVEFLADAEEKRQYEEAFAVLRAGDFDKASTQLMSFMRRYPGSGYQDAARYWLGNALYGKRDYKEAINQFRAFVTQAPTHARAPEALLAIANCQAEMKDAKTARRTLDELLKAYPSSEAAGAAKERLATLK